MHPLGWYTEHHVDLRVDNTVTAIDRRAQELITGDRDRLRYDKVPLATGATPPRLRVPGAELGGRRWPIAGPPAPRITYLLPVGTDYSARRGYGELHKAPQKGRSDDH